jgi:predicted metal-dependent hydrolase
MRVEEVDKEGWFDRGDFERVVRSWAERIGVIPHRIVFRQMAKKWGSCSSAGMLTFNVELLELERRFGEEVIVHELLHLKVPNHGPLFRSFLDAYLAELRGLKGARNVGLCHADDEQGGEA